MSIPFFPSIYPDELIYSVVARYGRWSAATASRVNMDLFGKQNCKLTYDIPLQISELVKAVGSDLGLNANQIIARHTLLPFYTALRPQQDYKRFRNKITAGVQIHRTLKGVRYATPWPDRLRYCPNCDEDNTRLYGSAIWLRRHQLITSLVCLKHRDFLLESDVNVLAGAKRQYVPASNRMSGGAAIAFPWSNRAISQYRAIAALGYSMLDSQDDPSRWWPAIDMRLLAWQKGFCIRGKTDILGLIAEFDLFYADILQLWPRLQSFEGRSGSHWLRPFLGGHQYTTNPICWALTFNFLNTRNDGLAADPKILAEHRRAPKPPKPELAPMVRDSKDDEGNADKVRIVAKRLRFATPPSRVTYQALLEGVPGLFSLIRLYPAPLTRVALAEEMESKEKFASRRLQWEFKQASLRGETLQLSNLLSRRRSFGNADLVRAEWHRYYNIGGPSDKFGSSKPE